MAGFLAFYRNLPGLIDPVALRIGPFSIGWYSVMYILAFWTVFFLLAYRMRKGEAPNASGTDLGLLIDFLLAVFVGLLIGGRLGYVIFYDFRFYLAHPLAVISPFDPDTRELVGIYGMSFHGGLIGGLLSGWLFLRKRRIGFRDFVDFVIPAVPLGYFFGRIGNFLNGELWGRATSEPWGMYFPDDGEGLLRHPSQLYEASLEGLVLFVFLWIFRNRPWAKGRMLALYLIGYGTARIFCEYFREPDSQIGFLAGGWLTMGQLLSIPMIAIGIFLLSKKERCGTIDSLRKET